MDSREAVGTKQPLLGGALDRWGMGSLGVIPEPAEICRVGVQ